MGGLTPVGWAFAGLLELMTGVPFKEMSRRWDELRGWERGLLGTMVAFFAFILMIVGSYVIVIILTALHN
jgi:hypothetical protein